MRPNSSISCFLYLLASTRKTSIVEATSSGIELDGDWQWHRVTDAAWIFDPVACFGVGRENSFLFSFEAGYNVSLSVAEDWGDGFGNSQHYTFTSDGKRDISRNVTGSSSNHIRVSHTYDAPGTYEPRFRVTLDNGTILPTDPLGDKFNVSENDCEIVNPPPKPDYAPVEWVTQVGGCGWTLGGPPPYVNRIALVVSEDYGGQNISINGSWDDGPDAIVVETREVPADGTTLFFEHTYSAAGDYSPMFSAHLEDGAIIEAYLYTPWKMRIFDYRNNIARCSPYYSPGYGSGSSGVPHNRSFAQCFLALLSLIFFAL